jgi:hypothetical protein
MAKDFGMRKDLVVFATAVRFHLGVGKIRPDSSTNESRIASLPRAPSWRSQEGHFRSTTNINDNSTVGLKKG